MPIRLIPHTITDAVTGQVTTTTIEVFISDEEANRETITAQAQAALTNNAAFLAVGSPTNAQVVAQVRALTQQNNKLIRLAIGKLDWTD